VLVLFFFINRDFYFLSSYGKKNSTIWKVFQQVGVDPGGGKFCYAAAIILNAVYHCSGMSIFFFLYSSSLKIGVGGGETVNQEYQRNNVDMPLQ
jgi:hypothetical protein